MYQVFDNDKPADCYSCNVDKSWNQSIYPTYDLALRYARKWLGTRWGGSADGNSGISLVVGVPYDYSGYGDMIEIRKVDSAP